ncbi:hypothetical protein GCM10028796_19350 [Ramlibacter monticola]|uniref:Uncharacterized protein n=1 Tax=Ramlibacter monticola TaxID=1926872 RepID=A0A937CU09_9BURK|nr:DUF6781 family protein [Ramlibacter monticola]MBL0392193.1 hypothetical protein [Ramlibacter monticola]
MTDPTAPLGNADSPTPADEQAIRERVRELTAQLLAGGKLDTEGLKEVVRAMSGGAGKPPLDSVQARAAFAETLRGLDLALQASSQAAHEALTELVARSSDFSDNDVKNAFAALQRLQADFVAAANHVADASSGNIRRELGELALHAQRVGADASVRIAQMMSEFANRMNESYHTRTAPGFEKVREYGANVSLFTSGLLAGVADALRQQADSRKAK